MPLKNRLRVQSRQQFARHLNLFQQLLQQVLGHVFSQFGVIQTVDLNALGHLVAVGAVHQLQPVVEHVITAQELAPHANRPARRCHVNREIFLNLVNDIKSIAAFAVHLVTEGQDRQIA